MNKVRVDESIGSAAAFSPERLPPLLAVTQSRWIFGVATSCCSCCSSCAFDRLKSLLSSPFIQQQKLFGRSGPRHIHHERRLRPAFSYSALLADINGLAPGWIGFVMVPGAVVAAILGGRGGKLADTKGTRYLFYTASTLLLLCFALLSTFAGVSPYLIALILVFGNVGQIFMQISLSKTISLSAPKEQTGVGMGLFSPLNFLSGAIATGCTAKPSILAPALLESAEPVPGCLHLQQHLYRPGCLASWSSSAVHL